MILLLKGEKNAPGGARKEGDGMEAIKEKELFEERPVADAILRLAFPTVVGQIVLVIYNLADTFFIGMTGSDAMLASVTLCLPALMFLSAIANLFGVGGASVIARALGYKDRDRAARTSAFSFWGCAIVTGLYSLGVLACLDGFIDLLGGTQAQVHGFAARYLTITVILGGLATSVNMLLSHLVRAEGNALQASAGVALGGLLNIILDPVFMFVLLPPGQEILGAALATALSNLLAAAYFLILVLTRKGDVSALSLRFSRQSLADRIPAEVLCAGLPACVMTLLENVSYAVLDKLMSLWGMPMQAGIGVAKKVNMLAHCIVRGIAQGALPLIAYSYAARNYRRMRQTVVLASAFAVSAACLCMGANLMLSRQLIEVFIPFGSASIAYGAGFLRILCLGSPFSACAYVIISFFQATGEGGKSFSLAILRKGVIDIPLMFLLNAVIPIYGIVWATPVADVLCCVSAAALSAAYLGRFVGAKGEKGLPPSVAKPVGMGYNKSCKALQEAR